MIVLLGLKLRIPINNEWRVGLDIVQYIGEIAQTNEVREVSLV